MEFLVHTQAHIPADMDPQQRGELYTAEAATAAELARAGRLKRLWRIPGRTANWGLWEAADATELHAAIASLPLFPYFDTEVVPLAKHPSDPSDGGS